MTDDLLVRLLDLNARFDLGARGTVNHLPMALVALARMGATADRLQGYFAWWEQNRALPRVDGSPIERRDWHRHRGDATAFPALADSFRTWIADAGADAVLAEVFPAIADGIAAAAFHGLIRLGYGIEVNHAGEIAAGLAALTARHQPLNLPAGSAAPAASAEAALAAVAAALDGARFEGNTITARLAAAAADPRLCEAMPGLPGASDELLPDLAGVAIRLLWQTDNFTVLHMVTAVHATRVVLTRHPGLATPALRHALWGAFGAAYATAGAPALDPAPGLIPAPLPWAELCRSAVASDDDHVIKLTYTCRCEEGRWGGRLYRAVAARAVGARLDSDAD